MAGEYWMARGRGGGGCGGVGGYGTTAAEERRLELTLAPPGGDRSWPAPGAPVGREVVVVQSKEDGPAPGLSLGLFPKCPKSGAGSSAGGKRGFVDVAAVDQTLSCGYKDTPQVENSHGGLGSGVDVEMACKMAFAAEKAPSPDRAVAQNNRTQTRTTIAPVVGWPPVRSFRKNMASSSRLAASACKAAPGADQPQKPPTENNSSCPKGVFVKINMEGIPIGRKVDLRSCDGYNSFSAAVDKLFRGLLLAAQKNPLAAAAASASALNSSDEGSRPVITGLLDGSGEYTLVYEDEEGDRILVGDVPWEMFITTAKRLRVLRTSELSKLSLGATSRKRAAPGSGVF